MMTRRKPTGPPRAAFTLVELLVVMFLLAFLAGLLFLIVPNINDQSRAPRGAGMLQQWLLIAKNDAMRDRTNWGVRLSFTGTQDIKTSTITYDPVQDLRYIQQPEDFVVLPGVATDPVGGGTLPFRRIYTANATTVVLEAGPQTAPDFSGGFTDSTLWPVQVGDYLEVNGGLPHLISAIGPSNSALPTVIDQLTLASPLPATLSKTNPVMNYRIIRSPRVVGEEQLQMPTDIGIDLNTNVQYGNPLPVVLTSVTQINPTTNKVAGTIDILFSPSGAMIGRGVSTDAIYLWVRDTTLPLFQGDNTLVTVQVRTGATFAFPVNNTPGGDPYAVAKTGRAPQS
jgi:hypothetical protein